MVATWHGERHRIRRGQQAGQNDPGRAQHLTRRLGQNPGAQQELKHNSVAQTIIEQGRVIEGMVRNTGKHACGVIIADQDITNLIPVTLQEGDLTTQYPKGRPRTSACSKWTFSGSKH